MKIYLAQMCWAGKQEPICAGTNKAKLLNKALEILREEHGHGNVYRHGAMCSAPISKDDIEIIEIHHIIPNMK